MQIAYPSKRRIERFKSPQQKLRAFRIKHCGRFWWDGDSRIFPYSGCITADEFRKFLKQMGCEYKTGLATDEHV